MCILSCTFRFPAWINALLHCLHLTGFSPVLILSCMFEPRTEPNTLPHSIHLNSFRPVCTVSCVFRFRSWQNASPHCLRLYSTLPVGEIAIFQPFISYSQQCITFRQYLKHLTTNRNKTKDDLSYSHHQSLRLGLPLTVRGLGFPLATMSKKIEQKTAFQKVNCKLGKLVNVTFSTYKTSE